MKSTSLRPRGVVLATVLLMLVMIALITGVVVSISSSTLRATGTSEDREAAFRAAESGARLALLELKKDRNWKGFMPAQQPMPGGAAKYEVKVLGPTDPPPDHGIIVPPGLFYVQSTGISSGGRVAQVGLMVKTGGGVLDYAAVVKGNIELKAGSVVESRNPLTDESLSAAASIVTNSVSPDSVLLDTGSRVNGMARPGVGAGSDAVTVKDGSEATMGYSPLSAEIPIDPVTLPRSVDLFGKVTIDGSSMTVDVNGTNINYPIGAPLPPGTYGELEVLNGGVLTLITGNYVFEKIKMQNGRVNVMLGDSVDFYSKNEVEILDSSFVNESKRPANMKFHVMRGDVKLDLSDGGAAYYILDAPNSNVELLSGSVQYGNLIAKNLKLDDASLYFDPAAGGALNPGGSTVPIVKSYQRF